jgi:hypothetical protein
MKIWAKTMAGDKIVKDVIYEDARSLTPLNFNLALREIAYALDIAVPVSLPTYFRHFSRFNRVKYLPRDFVEDVDFTCVVLELILEKK